MHHGSSWIIQFFLRTKIFRIFFFSQCWNPNLWMIIFLILGKEESNFKNCLKILQRYKIAAVVALIVLHKSCESSILSALAMKKFILMHNMHSMWWLVWMIIHCSIFVLYIIDKYTHQYTGLEISCNTKSKQ